jgi:sugar-specific transcriptional regulator TrmB
VQNQEEQIESLVELGLTHLQAKVYIALVCLETATAKEIHKSLNIARPDIYRMLSDLEEKDLIDRVISKPTEFKPTPPNEAISTLLRRKEEKTRLLRKKATQAFRKIQRNNKETAFADVGSRFILLSRSETNPMADFNRLREAVAKAQNTVAALTNFALFKNIKYMDEQVWKNAVERGVDFRFITNNTSNKRSEEKQVNIDSALKNSGNFQIRWTSTPPPTSFLLVDDKKVFFRMGLDLKSPVLLSFVPSFVAMAEDYFETKWKSLNSE